jgi:hypothetical protein
MQQKYAGVHIHYIAVESFTIDIERQIQVLWGLKLIQFIGPPFRKILLNHEYKISYNSAYLFTAPAWALEGVPASGEL